MLKDNKNCFDFCFDLDEWWNKYKDSLAPKISITISVLGGAGSIMLALGFGIPASIILGCCNVGIFFAGIMLERYHNKNKILEKDNENLKTQNVDINNRLSVYQFSTSRSVSPQKTPNNEPIIIIEKNIDTPMSINNYLNTRKNTIKPAFD